MGDAQGTFWSETIELLKYCFREILDWLENYGE